MISPNAVSPDTVSPDAVTVVVQRVNQDSPFIIGGPDIDVYSVDVIFAGSNFQKNCRIDFGEDLKPRDVVDIIFFDDTEEQGDFFEKILAAPAFIIESGNHEPSSLGELICHDCCLPGILRIMRVIDPYKPNVVWCDESITLTDDKMPKIPRRIFFKSKEGVMEYFDNNDKCQ